MKHLQLEDLYNKYRDEFYDREIVLGDGNVDARLLLIGEAPGKDEVKLSKPFVGAAGKNLTEFLEAIDVKRESIYITNAIKYRLSAINQRTGRTVNRPASKDEIEQSREYLLKEIGIINPSYIITLGNVPLRAVTGNYSITIGSTHGEAAAIFIKEAEYKLFPLYHPASVIYNQSLRTVYLEDLRKLKSMIYA